MEDENEVHACSTKASSIKAIDKKSVHRICSGQVVLTLATAVKELVENSVDAGATNVEVKLKDYGCESIEVIDNGSGVKEENFEGLTLKHHTSKLSDFEDLINVSTFGFRGEALSSLCALSNMVITTRHKSADVGTRIEFDLNGKIVSKKIFPKPIGTAVVIQNIFYSLPVRHKEFQKNVKREFARLIQVLNAYCLINTGVRISCVNQTSKGNRTPVVSTNGNTTVRENISNVFGSKQLLSLLQFKQVNPKENICSEYGLKVPQNPNDFCISGFVSSCEHGQGRSCNDRQFVFINKRPCDASKILKLINEVYHTYNRHQYPFVCISVDMKKESVDVNVTPDKRQVFLDGEKLLLAVLKTSLIEMFEPTSSVYKVNNASLSSPLLHHSSSSTSSNGSKPPPLLSSFSSPLPQSSEEKSAVSNSLSELKRSFSSAFDKNKDSPSTPVTFKTNKMSKSFSSFHSSSSFTRKVGDNSSPGGSIKQFFTPLRDKISSGMVKSDDVIRNGSVVIQPHVVSACGDNDNNNGEILKLKSTSTNNQQDESITITTNHLEMEDKDSTSLQLDERPESKIGNNNLSGVNKSGDCEVQSDVNDGNVFNVEVVGTEVKTSQQKCKHRDNVLDLAKSAAVEIAAMPESERCRDEDDCMNHEVVLVADVGGDSEEMVVEHEEWQSEEEPKRHKKELVITFSLDDLRTRWKKRKSSSAEQSTSFSRAFRAQIAPGDNKSAEEELQREISKNMFCKMQILGQFNLGFIITRLGSDLFIVDQHATDEKYNFEMLQKNHVLQSQKMIVPLSLDLTSSNETILQDSLDVFKKNGFDFLIEPEAPPTQRVKLISAPVSKNWSFGKEDIEELLFMLMDSPNVMCRPSRVRMMFASRACRKSIMIGTALNRNEMKRLVTHMGEIEQPWNCPHGRPTMRHLFNLNMLPS